tara:strand:+ start:623 stop:1297 length:675 start_codon:yes stop_codon:yes gene_type:complete
MRAYKVWFFDCDGVILDSNMVKTEAFRRVGQIYNPGAAEALVQYHVSHGGISRYQKFDFFFRDICADVDYKEKLDQALIEYGKCVSSELRQCEEIIGIRDFLEVLNERGDTLKFVVSGSDQEELRSVLKDRDLDRYFDGVFGSPEKKPQILAHLFARESIAGPDADCVFCGDSRHDYEVAMESNIEFIMIYGYTEWNNWRESIPRDIVCVRNFMELLEPQRKHV